MKQTAQGLAALGRGPDTQLVHMTPGEVKSLQQLAMAGGGSLTINPATGLPEAGFLSSMLPMLIGAGLAATGVGAPMAGLMVGGLQAARTGSLKKGLMAGFGAYGGAGLGGALSGAGATQGLMAGDAASQAAMGNAANAKDLLLARGAETAAPGMFGNAQAGLSNMGAGIQGLGSEAGRTAFMQNIGGAKGLGMAGLAAAAPMLMDTTTKQPEIKTDASMGQRYSYSPGATSPTPTPDVPGYGAQDQNFGREQMYFKPQYAKLSDEAARSMYGYAAGGPVEAMSNTNAIGASTGFPQSDIRTGAYSTPFQQPMGSNVVTGAQDAAVDPYTGQAQFADGGSVGDYIYDPVSKTYSKAGGQGITTVKPAGFGTDAQGGQGTADAPPGGLAGMTPAEQAAYYSANPTMAGITQALQAGFGMTGLGMAQNYMNPGFQDAQGAIARGISPQESFRSSEYSDPGSGGSNVGIGGSDISGQEAGTPALARGGMAQYASGGISNLGDYSDGGRLLRGPGDGVSDNIPAMIGKKQPARLADGEFVVPARIVSELGNGSTEAGARKLYAMMDRVQKSRGKTVGKGKVATNSRAEKHLPA